MAKTIQLMNKDNTKSIQDYISIIKKDLDAELAFEDIIHSDNTIVSLIVFERYTYSSNGYVSATVMFFQTKDECRVDIIGAGGGGGILNISMGSNGFIANEISMSLKRQGFVPLSQ